MPTHPPLLWPPDDVLAAHDAWSTGWGDLPYAAFRRSVPPLVQLGVLAHADWGRLDDLRSAGRNGRTGRPVHTWGRAGLAVVGAVLERAGSPAGLIALQELELQPLERRLLDTGRFELALAELVRLVEVTLSPDRARRTG